MQPRQETRLELPVQPVLVPLPFEALGMNVSIIRMAVGRSLFRLSAVAILLCLGYPRAAQGSLVVSVEAPTAVATPALQTLVTATLKVSGSLAAPLSTAGFGTLLSWSTSSPGVSGTNLYTVNASGSPALTTSMIADGTGFLYADASPQTDMTSPASGQRQAAVTAVEPFPTLPAGSFSNITIMQIRFAVSPNIKDALFNFSLNGAAPVYGFTDSNFDTVSFTDGGGSLLVTPEPSTLASALFGGAGVVGWWLVRSRRTAVSRGASASA